MIMTLTLRADANDLKPFEIMAKQFGIFAEYVNAVKPIKEVRRSNKVLSDLEKSVKDVNAYIKGKKKLKSAWELANEL